MLDGSETTSLSLYGGIGIGNADFSGKSLSPVGAGMIMGRLLLLWW